MKCIKKSVWQVWGGWRLQNFYLHIQLYSDDQHEKRMTRVYNLGIAHAQIGAIPYDILIVCLFCLFWV